MPHELAIAILHTAEKKSSVGEQATVQKKTPPGPPAGTRQWHRRWKGSLILTAHLSFLLYACDETCT